MIRTDGKQKFWLCRSNEIQSLATVFMKELNWIASRRLEVVLAGLLRSFPDAASFAAHHQLQIEQVQLFFPREQNQYQPSKQFSKGRSCLSVRHFKALLAVDYVVPRVLLKKRNVPHSNASSGVFTVKPAGKESIINSATGCFCLST